MAEESGFDRTEPASERRRQQAREEGQVARSRELSTLALLGAAGGGLWFLGSGLAGRLSSLMRQALQIGPESVESPDFMLWRLKASLVDVLFTFTPLFALLTAAAIAAGIAVNGWVLTFKPLAPDWNRLDPLRGIARVLSWQGLAEMVKAIAKALVVGGVAAWVMWHDAGSVLALAAAPLEAGIAGLARVAASAFLVMAASVALIAAVDVPFQIWDHSRKLRMTREELRQENKETEGDPQIKARIRSLQRDLARRRMMAEIPKADVVVTNPTHYAVALSYVGASMRAPRVVAKGAHLLAQRIRETAEEHGVPVLEAPPLARALYRHTDLGDDIPAALYTAVAEVLAYVYRLRRHREAGAPAPQRPELQSLPPGLDPEGA